MELELADESFFCSLGIRNVQTNHLAKAAFDMQQIIRYTQAWYVHSGGGLCVDFDTPILERDLPQIQCV